MKFSLVGVGGMKGNGNLLTGVRVFTGQISFSGFCSHMLVEGWVDILATT